MPNFSLYTRMRAQGTLAEPAKDIPDVAFALPATLNWMKALRILIENLNLNFSSATTFYASVQKRAFNDQEINTICEQLLFSLHQLSSLQALGSCSNKADVSRIAIIAWYYGIYGAASAMIAASDASFQDTHSATANQWDRQIASRGLAIDPFADRISSLMDPTAKQEVASYKKRGNGTLQNKPVTPLEAWGCCNEYLSGSVNWERWNIQENIKQQKDFKQLGVTDFRTKSARILRDTRFNNRSICFLHQASRYRGKANYRDAIYLAYGKSIQTLVEDYVEDLGKVMAAFLAMAGAYSSKRLGSSLWSDFIGDLEIKKSISIDIKSVWS